MGASLMWRPMTNGVALAGKGQLRDVLEKAYERWPLRLDKGDADHLRMIGRIQPAHADALEELAEAVEKHGKIEVWAEY